MRRILLVLALCLLPLPVFGQAQPQEQILDFHADISVMQNRTIIVTERLSYDFGLTARHGIYRDLPTTYEQSGSRYTVRYAVREVTNERGEAWEYALQHPRNTLRIRIGDPDKTITGKHQYHITYIVQRALPQFEGVDELYWNVTGNGWDVPIDAASATLSLPNATLPEQPSCYTGVTGSTTQGCTVETDEDNVVFFTAKKLAAGEGLTIAARLPAGTVTAETTQTRIGYFVADNWLVVLPLLAFIIMHWQWRKRGRDPQGRGTIIPQYESPRGMLPAVVGAVADNQVGAKEFAATLLHLAMRGYLTIKDLGKTGVLGSTHNYEFTRVKPADSALQPFERTLVSGIFAAGTVVSTKTLKNKFATTYQKVIVEARGQLVAHGIYARDPRIVQAASIVLGLLGIAVFVLVAVLQQGVLLLVPALSAGAAGIIVVIYGLLMPARTRLGAELLEEVRGFKWFLSVTEAERLKFHNAPDRKPEQFMEFLPFAVALGVEKQWAGQFADLAIPQPGWYDGNIGMFNAVIFANAIGGMSNDVHSALASTPGSSGAGGGGFSGGGFGGGGGGSW